MTNRRTTVFSGRSVFANQFPKHRYWKMDIVRRIVPFPAMRTSEMSSWVRQNASPASRFNGESAWNAWLNNYIQIAYPCLYDITYGGYDESPWKPAKQLQRKMTDIKSIMHVLFIIILAALPPVIFYLQSQKSIFTFVWSFLQWIFQEPTMDGKIFFEIQSCPLSLSLQSVVFFW